MAKPNINTLPSELLMEIAYYLDKVDLLSCNLVCRHWRNSLNLNELWYRYFVEDYLSGKSECPVLSQCNSRVLSEFPPTEGLDSLVAVCPWRMRYMQEVRISQNWRNGRFVSQFWTDDNEHGSLIKRMEKCDILCDHYNVITYHFLSQCFKVWDVQTMEYKEDISYSSNSDYVKYYCLADGTFIFVQSYNAKVYKRNNEKCFDLKLELNLQIPTKNQTKTAWYFCHNKNYFVASFIEDTGRNRSLVLIIHDLQFGSKHIEEIIFDNVTSHVNLQIISSGELFIGFHSLHHPLEYYYYNFLLKKCSSKLMIGCPVLINENRIIHLVRGNLAILWHHSEHEILKESNLVELLLDLLTTKECYPYVVFVFKKFDKMLIGNLETGSESVVSLGKTVDSVEIIRPSMVLLQFWKCDAFMDLWDLRTCLKLCRIQTSPVAVVTPCRTKLLVVANQETLVILHFW